MRIFLDIETIPGGEPDFTGLPDPDSITVPRGSPEVSADKRLKDPEKVAADIERKRAKLEQQRRDAAANARAAVAEQHRKGSLNALEGRVLCVGIAVDDGDPVVIMEDTERATLELLEKGLEHRRATLQDIWTYNGASFDLPFLARRAAKHELCGLARRLYIAKRWEPNDLYRVWSMDEWRARGSLDAVCELLGIDRAANPIGGADVYDRFLAGDLDAIREHCLDDIRVTREVWRRFHMYGWVK